MFLYKNLKKAVKGDKVLISKGNRTEEKPEWFTVTRTTKTTIVIRGCPKKEVRFLRAGGWAIKDKGRMYFNSWKIVDYEDNSIPKTKRVLVITMEIQDNIGVYLGNGSGWSASSLAINSSRTKKILNTNGITYVETEVDA